MVDVAGIGVTLSGCKTVAAWAKRLYGFSGGTCASRLETRPIPRIKLRPTACSRTQISCLYRAPSRTAISRRTFPLVVSRAHRTNQIASVTRSGPQLARCPLSTTPRALANSCGTSSSSSIMTGTSCAAGRSLVLEPAAATRRQPPTAARRQFTCSQPLSPAWQRSSRGSTPVRLQVLCSAAPLQQQQQQQQPSRPPPVGAPMAAAMGQPKEPSTEGDVLIEFKDVWKSFGRCACHISVQHSYNPLGPEACWPCRLSCCSCLCSCTQLLGLGTCSAVSAE